MIFNSKPGQRTQGQLIINHISWSKNADGSVTQLLKAFIKEKHNNSFMESETLEQLKYPIGPFRRPKTINPETLQSWIESIGAFPQKVEDLTGVLSKEELNWRYRPDGWTIKQVVHHCADSHMNAIIRFKLALTEDTPSIKPYLEDRWANLTDSLDDDISYSIMLLKGLHYRWAYMLRSLGKEKLKRTFYHPENRRESNLEETIGLYAWHCEHHLAHIRQALEHRGSF